MNTALASLGPLMAAPWRWRLNQVRPLALWGGALVLVLLLVLFGLIKGWVAAAFVAMVAGHALAVAAWMLALAGLRSQNHPHLARLMPGHVRRLRLAVLLLWGLPVLLVGAVAAWMQVDAWAFLLLAGLGLSLLTTFLRWPMSFVLTWCIPPALIPTWQHLPFVQGLTETWLTVWHSSPLWLCLPILTGLALFQMDLIGPGDEAHARRYLRMQRLLASMQDRTLGFNPCQQGFLGQRANRFFSALNRWYLDWLTRQPKDTLRHRLARLELMLYGNSHWSMVLGSTLGALPILLGGFGLLSLLVPDMRSGFAELPPEWFGIIAGQVWMGVSVGVMINAGPALQRSRREQALLVLLPGIPTQGALRAALLRRQGLLLLCMGLPGLLLLNAAGSPHPMPFLLGLGIGVMPGSLFLLRGWAQRSTASPVLLIGLDLTVGALWSQFAPAQADAWTRLGVIALLLAATLGLWVWALRRFARQTAAPLPFGRRAEERGR